MTQQTDPLLGIYKFSGDFSYLSNFHSAEFVWDGIAWYHSEGAYQAAKVADRSVRLAMSREKRPGEVKRMGAAVELVPDWDLIRIDVMREVVLAKFTQNPTLRELLSATGDLHLEEGNTWHDHFWGVCPPYSGNGRNELGNVLMDVRRILINGLEL